MLKNSARLVAVAVAMFAVVALVASGAGAATPNAATKQTKPPAIKHVFVINLENKGYDETFGATSPAPYLSQTLRSQGVLLEQYYGIGHVSLDNYIAEVSGQGPSKQTQLDCTTYTEFVSTGTGDLGQALGDGCVYPKSVKTIADQLTAKKLTWKGYMEDMATPCQHPELGTKDPNLVASAAAGKYATRHNPFVYFHSIIDSPICQTNVVALDALDTDLKSVKTTPNFSMITPGLCNDGHDAKCFDGSPGGLEAANTWLQQWVPKILASPAFKKDGLLIVTFDEADIGGPGAAEGCCTKAVPPNVANASVAPPGPGGGRVGAVLVSRFIKPGSTSATPYNHYAMLCSLEDIFGVKYLGYAAESGLQCFGKDVYNTASGAASG